MEILLLKYIDDEFIMSRGMFYIGDTIVEFRLCEDQECATNRTIYVLTNKEIPKEFEESCRLKIENLLCGSTRLGDPIIFINTELPVCQKY